MCDDPGDKNLGVVRRIFQSPAQRGSNTLRLTYHVALRYRVTSSKSRLLNSKLDI